MKLFARIVAALVLFLASAVHAAVTQTQLGTGNGTTTAVITTTAAAPTGSLVVVVVSVLTSNIAVSTVVDSALNCTTYTALDNTPVASRPTVAVFYCANTGSNLAIGATITVTVPSTDQVAATAFALSGMSTTPADIHAKQVNGASGTTATATPTGTLGSTYEVVVGALALNGTSSAFTPNAGFFSIGGVSSANGSAYAATLVACTTATVSFTPSWTTSRAYMSDVVSFKFAAADTQCGSKHNAYSVLQIGVPAAVNSTKLNMYAILQNAMSASKALAYSVMTAISENASKVNTYFVMQDVIGSSKLNTYDVLKPGVANAANLSKTNTYFTLQNAMAASKVNTYDVMQFGGSNQQNASKTNAYAVLQYSSSASKLNAYAVLKTKPASGFLFHSFP